MQINNLDYWWWRISIKRFGACLTGAFLGMCIFINGALGGPECAICSAVALISFSLVSVHLTNNHTEVITALLAAGKAFLIGLTAGVIFMMLFGIQIVISWGVYQHCLDARWLAVDYLAVSTIAWYFLLTVKRPRSPIPPSQPAVIVV